MMRTLPYADLHIHSTFSDGTMSAVEIVAAALENGVGTLAVADHEVLDAYAVISPLCKQAGIHTLPAVELDTFQDGVNYHVLAYGFRMDDAAFRAFVAEQRKKLDRVSDILIERMWLDSQPVSPEEYAAYSYDSRLGGWKALHYLMHRGLSGSLKEGLRFYAQYGASYGEVGFPDIAGACGAIHAADGLAILAHPGESILYSDLSSFEVALRRVAALGLDGIECYYPSHSCEITQACLQVCAQNKLLATAGSDCHGSFGKTRVGEGNVPATAVAFDAWEHHLS